jgi:serine/threonine protein kinase
MRARSARMRIIKKRKMTTKHLSFTVPLGERLLALGEQIGAGTSGDVFAAAVSPERSLSYALKVQSKTERWELEQECGFAELASSTGVGPRLHDWHFGPERSLMLFDRWTVSLFCVDIKTLLRPRERNWRFVRTKLARLIDRLHNTLKLLHMDLLPRNVLLRVSGNQMVTDVCITDFGHSERLSEADDPAEYGRGVYRNYRQQISPHCRNNEIVYFRRLVDSIGTQRKQLDALVRKDRCFLDRIILHSVQLCDCSKR